MKHSHRQLAHRSAQVLPHAKLPELAYAAISVLTPYLLAGALLLAFTH